MEGCSYCQHKCMIPIMNSLNYIMLTTRYLLLLQSFRQEKTIIQLLLEIKHIMQVGENSILLGYCALPLGVHCLLFWEHVMASSWIIIGCFCNGPLDVEDEALTESKSLENNTNRKRKYPTKTKFSSAPLQKPENSSIIQVCTYLHLKLEYTICKKEVQTVITTTFVYQFHCLLLAFVKSHHQMIKKYTNKDNFNTTY